MEILIELIFLVIAFVAKFFAYFIPICGLIVIVGYVINFIWRCLFGDKD